MQIKIDQSAHKWYLENINFESSKYLRIFPKFQRKTEHGFAIGIAPLKPSFNDYIFIKLDDITYYIEKTDIWYFEDSDLKIELRNEEPVYMKK